MLWSRQNNLTCINFKNINAAFIGFMFDVKYHFLKGF